MQACKHASMHAQLCAVLARYCLAHERCACCLGIRSSCVRRTLVYRTDTAFHNPAGMLTDLFGYTTVLACSVGSTAHWNVGFALGGTSRWEASGVGCLTVLATLETVCAACELDCALNRRSCAYILLLSELHRDRDGL